MLKISYNEPARLYRVASDLCAEGLHVKISGNTITVYIRNPTELEQANEVLRNATYLTFQKQNRQ